MADIQKLTYPYFTDGITQLNAANLNPIISKMNEMIDAINSGVTPTPTQTVATPTISISGSTATISCSTSGATIRYTTNGNNPTTTSGTIIASGGTVTLQSACTVKAIAYKDGMTTSQVASKSYSPSISPEAQAALAKFSNLSSAQQTKVKNFVDTLVSNSIYSKIHYLSLPLVAASVAEGLQNILSSATPPTIEFATINSGLKCTSKGIIDLTSLINGTVDYDAITLAFAGTADVATPGNTSRIIVCNHTNVNEQSTRIYHNITSGKLQMKGFDGNKDITLDNNNGAVAIISHDKTNSVEKYCVNSEGEITSAADSVTATNDGLVLSSATDQSSSSYNSYFSGTYKVIMLTDTLTDAQMQVLNTAIRTFIA